MWWKSLLVALLVLPPIAYVAGTLYAPTGAPEQRPALVIDDVSGGVSLVEPRVTLEPRPKAPRLSPRGDDRPDKAREDDRDDDGDDDDDDVTVVRPLPQNGDDDDDDDDDDRDDDRDDRDDGDD